MNRRSLWSLCVSLLAAGCTCGAFDPNVTRFACTSDDQCGAGSVCASANGGRECVLASATGGGGGAVTGGGTGGAGGGAATGGGGGAVGGGGGGATGGGDGGTAGGDGGTAGGDGGTTGGGGGATGGGGGATGGGGGGGGGVFTDGGTDGGPKDGGTDGGVGPPDHLAITTAPQTLFTSTCSTPLTIEVRDALNRPTPVSSNLQLALSSSLGQVSFYGNTLCTGATLFNTSILTGTSSTTVSFRGLLPGSAVLTASALPQPVGTVTQTQTFLTPPAGLAFVTAAPVAPVAGVCFLATVEAQSALGTPATVATNTTISLQSMPVGALRYFSNATCSLSTTTTVIPAGQSRASFYVKTISGGNDTVVATAPFGTANLGLQVTGVVRRGSCFIGSLNNSFNCPISPPHSSLSKAMVVYQATTSSNAPDDYEVRCRLTAVDTLSCVRNGGNSRADISWQTAELDTGLQVQRGAGSTCIPGVTPLTPAVNPASSFVLSSFSGIGSNFDGDDLSAARLSSDAGVALFLDNRSGQDCTGYEYQVVELSGVSTLRGTTVPLASGLRQITVSGLPAASTNSVLLNQALLSQAIPGSTSMCNLLVRGEMASPTSLLFSRGADNLNPAACANVSITEVPWERVDFGSRARVQAFTVTLGNNSTDVTIVAVDPTRTLVFAGGQMAGGQSSGETAVDNTNDDSIGQAQARFDLTSPTLVRVTRGRSQSTGIITFYVVELEP